MTFTTLQIGAKEMSLADWGISTCSREVSNQMHDHIAFDMMQPADAADPIAYGAQVILRIGRMAKGTGLNAQNLPISGNTNWSNGKVFFVGWRVENLRTGDPALEKMDLKFAGPWEFFFERLVFQKLFATYNGTANVADWRSQIVLGQSVNALIGPNDTVAGSSATNLMSIRQQVAEIIAYVVAQTTAVYGAAQVQSDPLEAEIDGTNWDLYEAPGPNLLIPDYIPGYEESGQTSGSANMKTVLRAPLESVNDITCAEALRHQLKWIGPMGEAAVWFDYTTTLAGAVCPTLKICTRDQLPSISVPMVGQNAGFKIKRRDDIIPSAVALKFRISGTFDDAQYVQVENDIAAVVNGTLYEGIGITGALYTAASFASDTPVFIGGAANSATMQALQNAGRTFASVTATFDMEGDSNKLARCLIKTMAVNINDPSTDSSAIPFWQKVFPEFKSLTAQPSIFSGSSVSVTVDDSGDADDGNTVDLSTYQYLLTDGQVAPWMLAGNAPGGAGAQVVQASINVKWDIEENTVSGSTNLNLGHKPYKEKTARVTLISIPGGLYQTQVSFSLGEVIPYGLAGFIYNIASIPHFEGSFSVQENEITDVCPMGNNFNISAGRAEWAAMNASVQNITYDLTAGKTTLVFGPAGHLGAKDLVERLRINRGPRSIYTIGWNIGNDANAQPGVQLGSNVAQRGPSAGSESFDHVIHPASLSDLGSYTYSHGVPGVTIDNRSSGQPNYGNGSGLSAPTGPGIFVAVGSGGTLSSWIRISTSDLPSGTEVSLAGLPSGTNIIAFQQLSWSQCVNIGGTPTMKTYSMYVWGSPPVETS